MSNLPQHLAYLSHLDQAVLKAIDGTSQIAQTLERQDLSGEMEQLNILETPIYDRLSKVQATAYEHEFNVITSRQDKIGYAVYRDGGVPRTVEMELARRKVVPSLIGQRITITELAIATTAAGVRTAEQTAREEKMIAVMEETEYLIVHGDRRFGSTDQSSGKNLQFNGFVNMIKEGAGQNVLDLRGQPLSLQALWAAENRVYQTQGSARPTTVFMSPIDKINLQASFNQLARTNAAERVGGVLGSDVQTFIGANGTSELHTSRFLGDWDKFSDMGFGTRGGEFARPVATFTVTGATVVAADPSGKGLAAGIYEYALKAFNFNGESEAKFIAPLTALLDNQNEITVAAGTSDPSTLGYIVYVKSDETKDTNGVKQWKFLKKVPFFGGGAAFKVVDDGYETLVSAYGSFRYRKIPGTGTVLGLDMRVNQLAQWIPLEQVPLPRTLSEDYAIRHVTSLYSRAAEYNYILVNCSQNSLV